MPGFRALKKEEKTMKWIAFLIVFSGSIVWAETPKDAEINKDSETITSDVMKIPSAVDAKTAIEQGKSLIIAAKSGKWWYFSAILIMLAMFIMKGLKILENIGRWKYIIVPTLSVIAALLASFQGGVSIEHAVGVFTTGWATGMLEELWNHGILGKPHNT
jgi:hypothetical protein